MAGLAATVLYWSIDAGYVLSPAFYLQPTEEIFGIARKQRNQKYSKNLI